MTLLEYLSRKLDLFREYCESSPRKNEQRCWIVISMLYLDPYTYDDQGIRFEWNITKIADKLEVDRSTIFNDLNWAYTELSGFLWGMTFC
jgi:hypothetical protein